MPLLCQLLLLSHQTLLPRLRHLVAATCSNAITDCVADAEKQVHSDHSPQGGQEQLIHSEHDFRAQVKSRALLDKCTDSQQEYFRRHFDPLKPAVGESLLGKVHKSDQGQSLLGNELQVGPRKPQDCHGDEESPSEEKEDWVQPYAVNSI